MKPYMTRCEMEFRLRNMGNDEDKLTVLAELNGCTRNEIAEFLEIASEVKVVLKKPTKDPCKNGIEEFMYRMYVLGCPDTFIANKIKTTSKNVWAWRRKNKLESKRVRGKNITTSELKTFEALFGEYRYNRLEQR